MALKGTPKAPHAGRRKGIPNKRTMDLYIKCHKMQIDPFEILLKFSAGDWKGLGYDSNTKKIVTRNGSFDVDTISVQERIEASKACCKYLHPERRPVDAQGGVEPTQKIIIYKSALLDEDADSNT